MLGDQRERLSVIPIGVDLEIFKPSLDRDSRKLFSLLTIGYLIERKGIDLILKALFSLKEDKIDVQFNIVGEGPERLNLEKMVRELGLESQVVFHGYIPHQKIGSFYRKSDIFCSMSLSESWGQVYLEAMASGLPLVVSKTNGSEGIVEDGVTGFLIAQGDVRGFATCVRKIIENEDLRSEMIKNAREKVEKEYDWALITQKYVSLYKKVLN
jgi:glycosyltransferase involved in cell wall biosynthesis